MMSSFANKATLAPAYKRLKKAEAKEKFLARTTSILKDGLATPEYEEAALALVMFVTRNTKNTKDPKHFYFEYGENMTNVMQAVTILGYLKRENSSVKRAAGLLDSMLSMNGENPLFGNCEVLSAAPTIPVQKQQGLVKVKEHFPA